MTKHDKSGTGNSAAQNSARQRADHHDAFFVNPACVEDDYRRMRRPRD